MESSYPLERTWILWEMWDQNSPKRSDEFQENMKRIGSFSNLHTFWQHWNYLPHSMPASLFTNPNTQKQPIVYPDQISIEAIGVFKQGVIPAWEDPMNMTGCDISLRKAFDMESLKHSWDYLVFSVIGESLRHSEEIMGCRVVDKVLTIKFEVWLKCSAGGPDAVKVNAIKEDLATTVFNTKPDDLRVCSHKSKLS